MLVRSQTRVSSRSAVWRTRTTASEPANWDHRESCIFDVKKSPRKTCSVALFSLILILQGTVVLIPALSACPFLTVAMFGLSMLWLLYLSGEEPMIQLLNAKIACGGPLHSKLLSPFDGLPRLEAGVNRSSLPGR